MKTRTKIVTATGAGVGLSLLVGTLMFFRTAPDVGTWPASTPAPSTPALTTAPPGDASALAPAHSATRQLPSPVRPDRAGGPATMEHSLPPAPSGDYELNLTDEQINAVVERRYGKLFQSLPLAPERLARLRSLLSERQQASVDAANAALLTGLNPMRDLPTITRAIELAQTEVDDTLRNELGDAVLAARAEYDRTLPQRNSVGDLARLLAPAGESLLPDQEKRLMQILQDPPGAVSPPDLAGAIFGGINARAPISNEAVAAAARVLSPRQLALLRELQQHPTPEDALP